MFLTTPIIMTSLKLASTKNSKQEECLHQINVEMRKRRSEPDILLEIQMGSPNLLAASLISPDQLQHIAEVSLREYNEKNRINTTIMPGEVERLKKILVPS